MFLVGLFLSAWHCTARAASLTPSSCVAVWRWRRRRGRGELGRQGALGATLLRITRAAEGNMLREPTPRWSGTQPCNPDPIRTLKQSILQQHAAISPDRKWLCHNGALRQTGPPRLQPLGAPILHPTSCPPSLASYALHTFVVCFESKLKGAMKEIKDIEECMKEQTGDWYQTVCWLPRITWR